MNERVQELALQAGLYVDLNGRPYPQALSAEETDAALKKFAQLIVRECAGLVQGVPTDTMGYNTADQKIKQHFGEDPTG